MESPIEVVRRFCAAWSDNVGAAELAAFFTDAAVYHNIPLAPVTGREAIAKTIASFIRPGKSFELQVMGAFEVSDGKINA
jgi:limonene-1,2-epoxide hydrolase